MEVLEYISKALEEIQQYRAIGTVEQLKTLQEDYWKLNEISKEYSAIGTVEEFKALKENQCKCEDCAGCTVWKCDCANTRQQAIDEFVKKICEKYTEEERKGNYKQYCGEIKQNIADIAEQLKG